MVKHRVNNSAKDSKEIRKVNEFERRKKEAELINKIKRSVPFFKRNAKCNKKEFLRTITGYVKLFHSFKNTSVQPLPLKLDEVFQSLVRSDEINVFVCDGDLNMIFCSDSAFASLGYQWNDVYNKKLSSLVYGRDQDAFQRQINALKEDVIESMQTKDFNITCRMVMKKKSKIPEGHHLVRITGTIEYQRELVTQKVAIQKAKNTHLSIRYEDSPDHDSAIKIRGSIGLIKDPDFLTSQIDYILRNNSEYRLVMDPNGVILFACHRIVSNLGYTPEEVIGKSAYEFMYAADRQMSLYAHAGTLRDNAGVIVHRLKDVCARIVYLRSEGRLEKTDEYIFFHIVATLLSEEEGEKLLRQYEADLMPQCYNKTVQELQAKVDNVANEKLLQLENQLAAAKMVDGCDNKAANSSNDRLKASTSDISSSPCSSSINSAFQGTLNESTENEFVEIASNAQSSPPGPSSQSSNLSTSSSSVPTLSPSTSVPSSSTQSPLSQSPSSQPCSSQSPPTYSLTPESQFTSDSSSMSQSMPSSASLSINYPVYATMNPYVPPTVMNSFPTNQRILQNQYYQFGTNQLCGMTSGQNAFVTNPKQMHIIITQCTISDQQTFFSTPVNNPQIIFQPTFPQYQTYNYNQEVQNIVGLDINQELQRVNVNDFVSSCDYEPELDLKQ